jgi:hypothetical protein
MRTLWQRVSLGERGGLAQLVVCQTNYRSDGDRNPARIPAKDRGSNRAIKILQIIWIDLGKVNVVEVTSLAAPACHELKVSPSSYLVFAGVEWYLPNGVNIRVACDNLPTHGSNCPRQVASRIIDLYLSRDCRREDAIAVRSQLSEQHPATSRR